MSKSNVVTSKESATSEPVYSTEVRDSSRPDQWTATIKIDRGGVTRDKSRTSEAIVTVGRMEYLVMKYPSRGPLASSANRSVKKDD